MDQLQLTADKQMQNPPVLPDRLRPGINLDSILKGYLSQTFHRVKPDNLAVPT